mmetsp:Transcript_61066/g.176932  ORF Transcript_61066/g.176932 Transcript_61066/m.176932 type:complete len:225 (+) Transcript_61066:439-1113(+)
MVLRRCLSLPGTRGPAQGFAVHGRRRLQRDAHLLFLQHLRLRGHVDQRAQRQGVHPPPDEGGVRGGRARVRLGRHRRQGTVRRLGGRRVVHGLAGAVALGQHRLPLRRVERSERHAQRGRQALPGRLGLHLRGLGHGAQPAVFRRRQGRGLRPALVLRGHGALQDPGSAPALVVPQWRHLPRPPHSLLLRDLRRQAVGGDDDDHHDDGRRREGAGGRGGRGQRR